MKTCKVEGCEAEHRAKGFCKFHYIRVRNTGNPGSVKSGRNPRISICMVDGCDRDHSAKGYCVMHYSRWKKTGNVGPAGSLKAAGGTGYIDARDGYRYLTRIGHANAIGSRGRIAEHTVIMSDLLGRPLKDSETVHHKNGIRDDNRPENLELWTSSHPRGQRVFDLVEWATEILAEYDPQHEIVEIFALGSIG